jgi:uncharacterized OB-fold protein
MTAPPPGPATLGAPYWEAIRAGRLELQRCGACRLWVHFPDVLCPTCGSDRLTFEEAPGDGVLETFTVIHRVFVPGFEDRAPYAVGWVALDLQPGLRLFADLVDIAATDLRIGQRLHPVFTTRDGDRVLSYAPTIHDPTDDHGGPS